MTYDIASRVDSMFRYARRPSPDNKLGQAAALVYLGETRLLTGDAPAATRDAHQALQLYRGLRHRRGQGNALTDPTLTVPTPA